MKHTKGQWSIKKTSYSNEIDYNCAVNSTKYRLVTDTTMFRKKNLIANIVGSEEEAQANANLIVSAPEMLSALKHFEEWLNAITNRNTEMEEEIKEVLSNIIKKAEGHK